MTLGHRQNTGWSRFLIDPGGRFSITHITSHKTRSALSFLPRLPGTVKIGSAGERSSAAVNRQLCEHYGAFVWPAKATK
jgi:hypothetical protein